MSFYTLYVILFLSSSYIGVPLLSWFQKFYLQGHPEGYLSVLPIVIGVTTGLVAVSLVILKKIINPIDRIYKSIKNENHVPTDKDKEIVAKTITIIKKVSAVIAVVGFLFGTLINYFIAVANGKALFDALRVSIVSLQALSFGAVSLLYTTYLFQLFAEKKFKAFKIQNFKRKDKSASMSFQLVFLVSTIIFFITMNLISVPYCIVANDSFFKIDDKISFFTKNTLIVFVSSILIIILPLSKYIQAIQLRFKDNTNKIKDLGQKGDLSERFDIGILDDFGELSSATNDFMQNLSKMITELKVGTEAVAKSSENLSTSTESSAVSVEYMTKSLKLIEEEGITQNSLVESINKDIAQLAKNASTMEQNMTQESVTMEQNSAAIAEMVSNINSVAKMTEKADAVSQNLAETSSAGNDMINQAVNSIQEIKAASIEVQNVVKVIQTIASQTNLLAMNAAIEAAHAGEVGAGFAVVADEVRALAASSSNSTKTIQNYIKDMVSKIDVGVSVIANAGNAFSQIENGVNDSLELVRTIANSMEEQKNGAEESLRAITLISGSLVESTNNVKAQGEHVNKIRIAMENAVSSANKVEELAKESNNNMNSVKQTIQNANIAATENKNAISKIEEQINKFSI